MRGAAVPLCPTARHRGRAPPPGARAPPSVVSLPLRQLLLLFHAAATASVAAAEPLLPPPLLPFVPLLQQLLLLFLHLLLSPVPLPYGPRWFPRTLKHSRFVEKKISAVRKYLVYIIRSPSGLKVSP